MSTQTAVQHAVSLQVLKNRGLRLPVCPSVFIKLQVLMGKPNASCGDLQQVIGLDPALAAQVLKAANAASQGLKSSVCGIDDAVLRLGFNEVWAIAFALNAKQAYAAGKWSDLAQNLWEHALRVGMLARLLGERINQRTSDVFFTAALLHDIGKLLLELADPGYEDHTLGGVVHGAALCAQERVRYGTTHPALGAELLRDWKVPAPVVRLVEGQHQDPLADLALARARCSFALANELAHNPKWIPEKGMTALEPGVSAKTVLEAAAITPEECHALAQKAGEQVFRLLAGAR